MKKVCYILMITLLMACSQSSELILEQASQMDLPQLSEFYKNNRYDYLKDAIVQSVAATNCSIDNINKIAELFAFDEDIYDEFQKIIKEKQRKLYATIYAQNCDSLLDALGNILLDDISKDIGKQITNFVVDDILETGLSTNNDEINSKVNDWLLVQKGIIDSIIITTFKEFVNVEQQKRKTFVNQNNMQQASVAVLHVNIDNRIPRIITFPELYKLSKIQNSTDWIGWGLTAVGVGSYFIPVYGSFISSAIDAASEGYYIASLEDNRNKIEKYATQACEKFLTSCKLMLMNK